MLNLYQNIIKNQIYLSDIVEKYININYLKNTIIFKTFFYKIKNYYEKIKNNYISIHISKNRFTKNFRK